MDFKFPFLFFSILLLMHGIGCEIQFVEYLGKLVSSFHHLQGTFEIKSHRATKSSTVYLPILTYRNIEYYFLVRYRVPT